MIKSNSRLKDTKKKFTKTELKERIEEKLSARGISSPKEATQEQMYHAVVYAMKDIMLDYRTEFKKRVRATEGKRVCYLCMEFLVGRSLKNYAMNLGLYPELCKILTDRKSVV